ncbi:hypothetical protein DFH09DRAFT_1093693 [Mycena vulgaris]|nr:hypothetical protein DFH09DRAFT_1093693 [Mycena vulgaris]
MALGPRKTGDVAVSITGSIDGLSPLSDDGALGPCTDFLVWSVLSIPFQFFITLVAAMFGSMNAGWQDRGHVHGFSSPIPPHSKTPPVKESEKTQLPNTPGNQSPPWGCSLRRSPKRSASSSFIEQFYQPGAGWMDAHMHCVQPGPSCRLI